MMYTLFLLQSLCNWNPHNSGSLLNTINDMLAEYKRYQGSLIDQASRLKFEYSSLLETSYDEGDIEIYVTKKGEVCLGFTVNLPNITHGPSN